MVKSGEEVLWRKPKRRETERGSERREKEIVERLIKKEHMAPEEVTSLGAMTVKTKGCVITWGP